MGSGGDLLVANSDLYHDGLHGWQRALELHGHAMVSATRQRIYDEQRGRWRPLAPLPGARVRTDPGGKALVDLGTVQRKNLIVVDVQP
jgi:hypothetical protein